MNGSFSLGTTGWSSFGGSSGASQGDAITTSATDAAFFVTSGALTSPNNEWGYAENTLLEALVADEDIGTLADIAKGTSFEPYALTMLDRETKEGRDEAYRKLKNRLKFGTEGALFNLALFGAGKGVQKLRTPAKEGVDAYLKTPVGGFFQKIGLGLSAQGGGSRKTFELLKGSQDSIQALEIGTMEAIKKTRFKPAKQRERSVGVWISIPVNFRLK